MAVKNNQQISDRELRKIIRKSFRESLKEVEADPWVIAMRKRRPWWRRWFR